MGIFFLQIRAAIFFLKVSRNIILIFQGISDGAKYYINPDLCKADRDANFRVRKERQRRRDAWVAAAAVAEKKKGT